MSGPIIRKYGFPNFEKIFGERELKHGAEGGTTPPPSTKPAELPRPVQKADASGEEWGNAKP
jgi:hypothetical protein